MRRETAPEILSKRLARLRQLEEVIEEDLDAWLRLGVALQEIREEKLYLETHQTFEAWARERFQISRARAYQLIDAVRVRSYLSTAVDKLPTNEHQTRLLSALKPELQIKAWEQVIAKTDIDADVSTKDIKQVIRDIKHEVRTARLAKISAGNQELGTEQLYPVILADPPWRYDEATVDPTRQIGNQYPTMSLQEICELQVGEKLAPVDAVCFLWAAAPLLPEALLVMDSWGFQYRSNAVWDKVRIGMGYWFRGRHEHLLVGVRGNPPKPAPSERYPSIVKVKRSGHSEKPREVHELIENYYPDLPKVELFARAPRDGWSVWGNQCST